MLLKSCNKDNGWSILVGKEYQRRWRNWYYGVAREKMAWGCFPSIPPSLPRHTHTYILCNEMQSIRCWEKKRKKLRRGFLNLDIEHDVWGETQGFTRRGGEVVETYIRCTFKLKISLKSMRATAVSSKHNYNNTKAPHQSNVRGPPSFA